MNRHELLPLLQLIILAWPLQAQTVKEVAAFKGHAFKVDRVAISPDGMVLASGGGDTTGGELRLWNAKTGRRIASLPGYKGTLEALSFSPDGKILASGSNEQGIAFWDVATAEELRSCKNSAGQLLQGLAFSLDSKTLASTTYQDVSLWNVSDGKFVRSFKRIVPYQANTFSKDLRLLAAANYQEIDLWDVQTGKLRRVLSEHRGKVGCVKFCLDDATLAAASSRGVEDSRWIGEIRFWDVHTGKLRSMLKGEYGYVTDLVLSPDGKKIVLVDWKQLDEKAELKLIEISTGTARTLHKAFWRSFYCVRFTAEARLIFAAESGKDVTLWEVTIPKTVSDGQP